MLEGGQHSSAGEEVQEARACQDQCGTYLGERPLVCHRPSRTTRWSTFPRAGGVKKLRGRYLHSRGPDGGSGSRGRARRVIEFPGRGWRHCFPCIAVDCGPAAGVRGDLTRRSGRRRRLGMGRWTPARASRGTRASGRDIKGDGRHQLRSSGGSAHGSLSATDLSHVGLKRLPIVLPDAA